MYWLCKYVAAASLPPASGMSRGNDFYKKKVKLSTIKAVNNTKINLFRTYFGIFFPPLIKSINMHNAI